MKKVRRSVLGVVGATLLVGVFATSIPASAQAACGLPSIARMWKDGSCNGSYLSMYKNDQIPRLSTYGFGGNISSAEAGQCQSIRMWTDINYGGNQQYIAAAGFVTLVTYNNQYDSSRSYANASC